MLVEMVIAFLGLFITAPPTPTAAAALTGHMALGPWGAPAAAAQVALRPHYHPSPYIYYPTLVLLGVFLFALMHHRGFRRRCKRALVKATRGARVVFVDLPWRLVQIPVLRRIVTSWSFQLFYWYFLKPVVVC